MYNIFEPQSDSNNPELERLILEEFDKEMDELHNNTIDNDK